MKPVYSLAVLGILTVSVGSEGLPPSATSHPDLSVLWRSEDVGIIKDGVELLLELEMNSGCKVLKWETENNENVTELCEEFFQSSIVSVMKEACDNTEASWNSSGTHVKHLPIKSTSEYSTGVSFISDFQLMESFPNSKKMHVSPSMIHEKFEQFVLEATKNYRISGRPATKDLLFLGKKLLLIAVLIKLLKKLKKEKSVGCVGDCAMDLSEPYSCQYNPSGDAFLFKIIIPRLSSEDHVLTADLFKIRVEKESDCGSGTARRISCDGIYNGPSTVVYNSDEQCIRGIKGLIAHDQQHIFDKELPEACQHPQSIKEMSKLDCSEVLTKPSFQVHRDESGRAFIYCARGHIIVEKARYQCPDSVFSLPADTTFELQMDDIVWVHGSNGGNGVPVVARKPTSTSIRDFLLRDLQPTFVRNLDDVITQQQCNLANT